MSREGTLTDYTSSPDVSRAVRTHTQTSTSKSVHDSLLQLLKTNCMISSSTVFQVRFWCRFYIWSFMCRPDTQTQNRHGAITNDRNLTKEPCIYQVCSLTRSPQEPSIHRPSFTHFTLVLQSIHTCQGREHSPTKRPVETSAVRSAPTHKPAHQSQYSVHDSLLQHLKNKMYDIKFHCNPSPVLVSFLYVIMCPDTQTHFKTVRVKSQERP
jgi:hypothetical protein